MAILFEMHLQNLGFLFDVNIDLKLPKSIGHAQFALFYDFYDDSLFLKCNLHLLLQKFPQFFCSKITAMIFQNSDFLMRELQ